MNILTKASSLLTTLDHLVAPTFGPGGSSILVRDNRGTTFTSKDGSEIVNNYVSKDEDTKALLNLIHTTLTPQNGGTVVGFKTALHITKTLVEGFRRDLQEGLIHPNDVKKAIEDLQIALEKKLKEYKVQNLITPNLTSSDASKAPVAATNTMIEEGAWMH